MTPLGRLATIPVTHMHTANEKRKSPRASADLDMRFDLAGQAGFARIRDVSASGVRCVTERAMPLMTQVELVIVLPAPTGRREILCRGAVVRCGPIAADPSGGKGPSFETAIFFTQMRDTDRIDLEEFVSSIRRSNAH